MSGEFESGAKLLEALLNGRPTPPKDEPPPKVAVTVEELIRRRTSLVRFRDRLYRIEVREMEVTKAGTRTAEPMDPE